MSLQQPAGSIGLESLPDDLETPTAKLTYLAIDRADGTTVDRLSDRLGMQKLVLFETVRTLESRDLIESDGRRLTTR